MKIKDLKNKKFGYLTPVSYESRKYPSGGSYILWKCKCDCGNFTETSYGHLKSGHTKSCGCKKSKMCSDAQKMDLINKKFNRLLVIEEADKISNRDILWKCLCDCGKITFVITNKLINGYTKSCGCWKNELASIRFKKLALNQKGSNHPSWNPDLTDEDRKYRRSPEFQQWSKQIKIRDNFICQNCTQKGGELHSHHLYSYRSHMDKKDNLDNGITLCINCHNIFHDKYGYNTTKEQFEEFKELFEKGLIYEKK